jgi:tetratricopeptide (TPR) repeat protein
MGKQVLRQQISLAEFERKEVAERLADPLTLMMAALMTLESGASALSLNRTDLAFEASQKLVADRMKEAVKNHKDLFLHMAAYATLCGGLQEEEALAILEGESRETHLGNVPDPKAFLERLQAWLPGEKTKTWIGVIEPDIVGEAFVLGKGKRPHLQSAEAAVMRAAGHKSGPTVQALVRMAQDFSFAEAEERLEPLEWLAKLIESGEADNNLALLIDLSDALPESSVVLTEIGVSISTILCDRLRRLFEAVEGHPSTELQSLFAVSLIILSIRQSAVGQWETALATNEEAVVLYRELMARNRDAYLPELAMALNNLANRQREAGQRETALATAEQAIALRRELVTRDRDTFLPNLAMSLNNLAVMQSDAGKKNEALVTAQEAVVVYRELAARNRDAALSDLAMSLNTLALRQLAAKHQNEALVAAHETAALYRELAGRNRDAFLPDLAMSLNNLATIQSDRQRETALATAWEAATLYKELAERNPDAFLSDLAVSLTTLARLQSMAEQHEAALAVAQEATAICRQLATSNYASFQERLARACGILGVTLTALGRHTDAAASFAEGIRTVLPSVKQYPVAYVELYIVLLGEYLSAAKAASIEPDEALVQETFPVLDPYLTKEGEQP